MDDLTARRIGECFGELAERHVLGAALAVADPDGVRSFVHGVASLRTRLPVTEETRFLVGSTSKAYTAVMLLQLAGEGLVDLDAPLATVLPDVALARRPEADGMTTRQLLSHSAGIDNGPYDDVHGSGDDAVARYVDGLADLPLVHPPGERFGYSNAGYVVAGLIVERLTGLTWDEALARRILAPLGLQETHTRPEQLLLQPCAVGHVMGGDGDQQALQVAARWGVSGRAMGPTGSTLAASARDLAAFGAALAGGGSWQGRRLLDPDSTWAMHQPAVAMPPGSAIARHWGLGLLLEDWHGAPVAGHTGHNNGVGSWLRWFPGHDTTFALLFNSPGDATLYLELFAALAEDLLGIRKADPWLPVDGALDLDLTAYEGHYRSSGYALTFSAQDDRLEVADPDGRLQRVLGGTTLRPVTRHAFAAEAAGQYSAAAPPGHAVPVVHFDGFEGGRPRYAYTVVFANRRADHHPDEESP